MSETARNILLLAGRLHEWPDAWRLAPLANRVRSLGFNVQILCAANGGVLPADAAWLECPALESRWLRPWAVRALNLHQSPHRPHLIHVLQPDMGHAAIA